jgi:hypothetical protein
MPFGEYYNLLQAASLTCYCRFCFILNKSRPLLDLEKKFFDEARAGNGLYV